MLNTLAIFGTTLAVFLLVIVAMAVGVLFGRRQISGSCGGLANQTDADGQTSCSLCSNPEAACRELSARRHSKAKSHSHSGHTSGLDCDLDCETEGCSPEKINSCQSG